ncbi:hypothetical protein FM120_00185 [Sphingobacterium faecium PCAi_F2.5]|nr:hypothetical protein FM120_00185 [Sphingobacterium faecium PCAi_F2.5]
MAVKGVICGSRIVNCCVSGIDYTLAAEWFILKHRYWDMLHPKDRKSLAHKKAPTV